MNKPVQRSLGWGTSLAVQWLRLCPSNAGGKGSIPGQGTKIPHAVQRGQNINKQIKVKIKIVPLQRSLLWDYF